MGDINVWVDSMIYNIVENAHQYFLLTCIDLINQKNKTKMKVRYSYLKQQFSNCPSLWKKLKLFVGKKTLLLEKN